MALSYHSSHSYTVLQYHAVFVKKAHITEQKWWKANLLLEPWMTFLVIEVGASRKVWKQMNLESYL